MRETVERNAAQLGPHCIIKWCSSPPHPSSLPTTLHRVRIFLNRIDSVPKKWRLTLFCIFHRLLQVFLQTVPRHISILESLNQECRNHGVIFILAFTLGIYGSIFVDAGNRSSLFPNQPTASGSIIYSILPALDKSYYRITVPNCWGACNRHFGHFIGLSSSNSSNLPRNDSISVPAIVTAEMLSGSELFPPRPELTGGPVLPPVPRPFEGLRFPIDTSIGSHQDSIVIKDPYDVLEAHLGEVQSWYWCDTEIKIRHVSISSSLSSSSLTSSSLFTFSDNNMIANADGYKRVLRSTLGIEEDDPSHPAHSASTSPIPSSSSSSPSSSPSSPDSIMLSRLKSAASSSFDIQTSFFAPTNSFIGASVAHEMLKICSGVGVPLSQWLLFDVPELSASSLSLGSSSPTSLHSAKVSIAGCGPLGFELAKNIVFSGIASSSGGAVHLVDDELLRRRHLPDIAFLVDPHSDLLSPRSTCLSNAMSKMGFTGKVRAVTESPLAENSTAEYCAFLWDTDLVFSAAKSSTQRLFIDEQCVFFGTPMIDGGVDGPLGSVQVCIPHLTNNYAAYKDPYVPDPFMSHQKAATFPTSFIDCIVWARNIITTTDLVSLRLAAYSAFQQDPNLEKMPSISLSKPYELIYRSPKTLEDCIQWAVDWFVYTFDYGPRLQLLSIPLSQVNFEGEKFWKMGRIPPRSVLLDLGLEDHRSVIILASIFRAITYRLLPTHSEKDPASSIERHYREQSAAILKAARGMSPLSFHSALEYASEDDNVTRVRLSAELSRIFGSETPLDLPPILDLDWGLHTDNQMLLELLRSVSNVRSSCYGLGTISTLDILLLASPNAHLTPITTTSIVASLMTIEAIKFLSAPKINETTSSIHSGTASPPVLYQDRFFGLSSNVFLNAPSTKLQVNIVLGNRCFTNWDLLHINAHPSMTISQLLDIIKDMYNVETTFLAAGTSLIYTNILPHVQRRMFGNLRQTAQALASGSRPHSRQPFVELTLSGESADGEDVDAFPKIFLHWTGEHPYDDEDE